MAIVVNGSVAFDQIMTFKDYFKNHILPDKVHMISVSFLIDSLRRRRGGCGANISYNMALLGQPSVLWAAVGHDFLEYGEHLEGLGVDVGYVALVEEEPTASGYVMTDLADNQIWAFYPGAMDHTDRLSLKSFDEPIELMVISPNHPPSMLKFARECHELGCPYVFDPGQSLTALSGDDILEATNGAWLVVGNDYELELIRSRTGMGPRDLLELTPNVVVTLGENGARLITEERDVNVAAVAAERLTDPTGAGDAYRAGLIVAMLRGSDLETAGKVAALMGTYAVESEGTQEHTFTPEQFAGRYRKAWGSDVPDGLLRARAEV
jgi:adenosine kinase